MLIDLTVAVGADSRAKATEQEDRARSGHLGTHFDVMDKVFPLEFVRRKGVVFDVSGLGDRDIDVVDIDGGQVGADMFVAFRTGYLEKIGYASGPYFTDHPQLSNALLDELLRKKVSIVGVDFAGVRRGQEHTIRDQEFADQGAFVVENLANLGKVLNGKKSAKFIANTYPVNFTFMTGLPCRVVAEI